MEVRLSLMYSILKVKLLDLFFFLLVTDKIVFELDLKAARSPSIVAISTEAQSEHSILLTACK